MKMKCDFSYNHYSETIELALSKGYKFYPIREAELALAGEKSAVMRHDVDHQLELALNMAEVEATLGISTTYFLRVHAKGYSPLSLKSTKIMKKIQELGHEIGFHYEGSYASVHGLSHKDCFKADLEILRYSSGAEIVSVSPHEPTREGGYHIPEDWMSENNLKFQAYDGIFMNKMKYISDSSCNWREGCMHNFFASATQDKLCVLTHPFWWFSDSVLENY